MMIGMSISWCKAPTSSPLTLTQPGCGCLSRLTMRPLAGSITSTCSTASNPTDKALLEHSTGGWNFREVARCDYNIQRDTLVVAIPKSSLDITDKAFKLDFKWYDNMQHDGDIMDVYNYGTAVPGGRFNFRYRVE